MTPDQLRDYVDAAFKQRDSFALFYFIIVPIISIGGGFLVAYLTEKGKNTATKEDIGKITSDVESAKALYTERLEHLRAELGSKSHYGRVRYEREMKIYEDLWPKLCALREAVLSLRPVMDSGLSEGETEETRKQKRAESSFETYRALGRAVEHNRPFYPPTIWNELRKLLDLCWSEAVEYRFSDQRDGWKDYWDRAQANSKAITEQVDHTCEAIRTRLAVFDEA